MERKSGNFFGETGLQRVVGNLVLSENRYHPDQTTEPHSHESALFYLVLNGTCREKAHRHSHVHPGTTLVFLNAGETHSTHWSPDAEGRCFHLEINTAFSARSLYSETLLPRIGSLSVTGTAPPLRLARRLHAEFLKWDRHSSLIAEGIVLELLGELGRTSTPDVRRGVPWLTAVEARLREPLDITPTLAELSDLAGVHPSHLLRVFRDCYRMTPGEFLRQRRIEEACRRLCKETDESGIPLSALAHELGFSDQSHFTRTFRALTGVSPGAYRRAHGMSARHCK